ncbi:MAG: glycosyltransferase family 4 protein, partial [Solirubrobacteraceae bacterium]
MTSSRAPQSALPPYAFVQQGPFSGTNAALRAALDPALGRESALIDTHDYRRIGRGSVLNVPLGNYPSHLRQYGRMARRDPSTFIARRLETSYMYEHRSAVARRAVRAIDAPFVVQTATMFDAKTDDRPLFMYTDHTMLATHRYGRFAEDLRGRERWIELERQTYHACELVFTTSEFARVSIIEDYGVPDERVIVAGTGTNSAVPAEPTEHRAEPTQIAFIGKQWERKGGPILVEAFEAVRRDHPELRLVVAGCSPEVDVPGVDVRGIITREEVGALLRESDIFAMPSSVEPSAIVYSEAAAHSLPVLATSLGGTPERVLDGETGLLSPAADAAALAENLRRLVEEPGLATRLGAAGFRLVQE